MRLFILLVSNASAADPNVPPSDPNEFIKWAVAYNEARPRPPRPEPNEPFHVIGIKNEWIDWPTNLKVEVFMRSEGDLYLLHNPNAGYNKDPLPNKEPVRRKTGKIIRVYNPIPVWDRLKPGLQVLDAATHNDPNHYLHSYIREEFQGVYSSKQLEFFDFAGTGRSFGIGIDGDFDWVKIIVEQKDKEPKVFEVKFSVADHNKDGIVDMRDFIYYSQDWLKRAKLEQK